MTSASEAHPSGGHPREWRESLTVTAAGTLLVAVLCWPAMTTPFFGENFQYLGQYLRAGSFRAALFSASDHIFFRPAFFAASLPWYFVLPNVAFAYHLRNLLFTAVDLLLLHRFAVRFIASRKGRAIAVIAFASSKVHLTTIGYLNIFDSIVMLLLLLLTLIFIARTVEAPTAANYTGALLFLTLSIFSKDFGMAAVPVAAVFWWQQMRARGASASIRKASILACPVAAVVGIYFIIRSRIVERVPAGSVYSPSFSLERSVIKTVQWLSNVVNVSLMNNGTSGDYGVAGKIVERLGRASLSAASAEAAVLAVAMTFLLAAAVRARVDCARVLVVVVWMAMYFAPTLLTTNMQQYYGYESIAAFSLLAGSVFGALSGRFWRVGGAAVLFLAVANGFASNASPVYHWSNVSSAAGRAMAEIRRRYAPGRTESIEVVSSRPAFWAYALGTPEDTPLLPRLLASPGLRVSYLDDSAGAGVTETPSGEVVWPDGKPAGALPAAPRPLETGGPAQAADHSAAPGELRLERLSPAVITLGQRANPQPGDTRSAIAVRSESATRHTSIVVDGHALPTSYGGPTFLSAFLPPELVAVPGHHRVMLSDGPRRSNQLILTVRERE